MPRLSVDDLLDSSRFQLLDTLHHLDLAPFLVAYYLKRSNRVVASHYVGMALFLCGAIWAGVAAGMSASAWWVQSGGVVLAWLVLIPIHEGLHALVYRLLGARDIRFGFSLRNLYAYAIAHRFVVDRREFTWLALAPTLAINGGLLILTGLSEPLRFFALALSLLHFSSAAGDWAMLSYLWEKRAHPVFTYDDAATQSSFFYRRIEPTLE